MSCLLHPQIPAVAACEYCTQPHCAACLRQFMSRSYCPSCYEQVYAMATGASPNGASARSRNGAAPAGDGGRRGTNRPRVPGWLSAILYLAGFLVLEMASGRGLQIALIVAHLVARAPLPSHGSAGAMFDASGLGGPTWAAIVGAVGWASCIMVLLYTALTARLMEKRSLGALGLRWYPHVGRDFLVGSALAAVLFVSIVGVGFLLGWFSMSLASPWSAALVILPFGFLVLLPFAAIEEITMRGFLFYATSRSWGRVGALIATSVAFAALHTRNDHFGDQPWTWLGLFLAGIYLGSAYLITNRIWLPLFLHTVWNLMEGPIFGLPVSGITLPTTLLRTQPVGPAAWTGGSFGPEGGLLLCLLLLVHIAFLWVLRPLLATNEPAPVQADAPASPEVRTYRAIPL